MPAFRYTRLLCDRNNGDGSWTQLAEIALYDTIGGTDVTVAGSGRASVNGTIQSGSAANTIANDGSASWVQWSGTGYGLHWTYDHGEGNEKDIVQVGMWGAVGNANRAFGEFYVLGSNDLINWTQLWICSAPTNYVDNVEFKYTKPVDNGLFSLVRVRAVDRFIGNSGALWVNELEIASTVGGPTLTAGATATARTTYSNWAPSSAIDGNYTNAHASNANRPYYESLAIQLTAAHPIKHVRMWNHNGADWDFMNYTGFIEVGNDPNNWLMWVDYSVNGRLAGWGGPWDFIRPEDIPNEGANKYRMYGVRILSSAHGTACGLRNIVMRAETGGANICTGGKAAVNWPDGTCEPPNLFDGTDTDAGFRKMPATILYDWGIGNGKARPAQILLSAPATATYAPTTFEFVGSNDGINVDVLETFNSPAAWTTGEVRTFDITPPPPSGRRRPLILC